MDGTRLNVARCIIISPSGFSSFAKKKEDCARMMESPLALCRLLDFPSTGVEARIYMHGIRTRLEGLFVMDIYYMPDNGLNSLSIGCAEVRFLMRCEGVSIYPIYYWSTVLEFNSQIFLCISNGSSLLYTAMRLCASISVD